ncbi:hypothetical protein [Sphingobacterium paucimobilis]|uniref:Uncharacterized protein n=1 Tax=Sphingobacterium paucimobilis HER1398 TaxID=1346330 RepID=U2HFX4_9SPHI|nr:hypothetical protein [Sphingobacterium paucimobilis]ERJ60656.1 hypothetical protein M472_18015 [Sphingobacterium paucimobilis HER1398]
MKTISKIMVGIIGIMCLFASLQVKAQDRYGYCTFKKYDNGTNTQYLVISDPFRNWYETSNGKMTDQEKEAWTASFRAQANKQVGSQLMRTSDKPVPYRGEYNHFTSESACREGITKEVNDFNNGHKNAPQYQDGYPGGKSYYKVIYVYPSRR